jgi:hypothetical protein
VTEPDRNEIASRLRRLPGQLLMALINATAILVIVAAILALVALARIGHFADNVAAGMTEAVLSKVDLPSKDVLANLRNLTAEVRALRNTVEEFKAGESPALQFEVAQLKEKLAVLNSSVERLRNARSIFTDEAIRQLSRTATDALMKLRNCSSTAGQMTGRHARASNTVEVREAAGLHKAGHESLDGAGLASGTSVGHALRSAPRQSHEPE